MTPPPADQPVRDRALEPRASFHLEAPAGSGKTSVLLARFLTLLARVEAPEELLALTFTRKAAGELRARVMQLLAPGPRPDPDSELERQLADLAQQVFRHFSRKPGSLQEILAPERLPVMTFHSFCARLVALAPQEAQVPLEFRLLEDREAEWLKQEALEELRRRLAARPAGDPVRQALVNRLLRLNNNWPRLAGELRDLLERRDTLKDFLDLADKSRDLEAYRALMTKRLADLIHPELEELSRQLAASSLGETWPDLVPKLRQAHPVGAALPRELPRPRLEDLGGWQALAQMLLTKNGHKRKQFPSTQGFPPKFADFLEDLPPEFFTRLASYQNLPPELVYAEEVAALHDLVLLLWEALTVYGELCRRRGVLDYVELEMAALRLLAAGRLTDLLLDWPLRHLLVDEFQDTSENQKTLLCHLLSFWEDEPGRTLTVVGDPTQSIYGWRKAKLSLFLESRRGLRCESGFTFALEPLRLTTNFRASRALISWVNEVFQTVMAGLPEPERSAFQSATPAPAADSGEWPHLALFTDPDRDAARRAEARWLASRLRQTLGELQEDETVGVLLFSRRHLRDYLEALQQAGLNVRVKEGLRLADSRVVQHLHNLARALARPHDDVAWAALLAGPWAPQPLAVLAQAAQTPGELWCEKLRRFAAEAACPPTLQQALGALLQVWPQTGRAPLHETLRQFLEAADAWSGIAAWEGAAGAANARAYLELLAEAEAGYPEATFARADFHLAEAYQPPDPRAQDSPIELMTVHGAKGLEFDWVFVPYLDWQPLRMGGRTPPPFLLEEIPGTSTYGLALARPYWESSHSLLYSSLKRLQDSRTLAEARRLFYVAATRAKKRLYFSAVCQPDAQGRLKPPSNSPLAWLWQHYLPEEFPSDRPATLTEPLLYVEVCREVPPVEAPPVQPVSLPEAMSFTPEPAPYVLVFPSQLAEAPPAAPAETEARPDAAAPEDLLARVRGEVIHALLEDASRGLPLPGADSVAAALRQGGLDPDTAKREAPEVLAEVQACLADPFLAALLSPNLPEGLSEWLLEDAPEQGVIRRGKIDRFACDGKEWWLLDYKTSRPEPGGDWEAQKPSTW
ncbi:MAG: UvrD-helicase domain-containing protein [Deltaproteobacteria bacterium]|nr:UvrD-helicase domain-containing protein [Deltaproteobacteria bacterium]